MHSALISLVVLTAIAYLAMCATLYLGQDRSIFFPHPNDPQLRQQRQAQRVEIQTKDAVLEGWWVENPNAANAVLIIYFGGNAEDVLFTAGEHSKFEARQMLVVNYRGYGGSTGMPGQKALYDDALAIYDYAIQRGIRPDQIVVMGRSLGSSLAAMLAGTHRVRGAILVTPFDSLAAVGAAHYPYFPVRLLLKHPFPSIDYAKTAREPALFLAAERDVLIPPSHARKLFEAWHGKKQIHVLKGMGHNDIEMHGEYYRLINAFLADPDVAVQEHDAERLALGRIGPPS